MKVAWLPLGLRECLRFSFAPRPMVPKSCLRQQARRNISSKHTSSSRLRAGIAAAEIKFKGQSEVGEEGEEEEEPVFYARVVPESQSYFSTQPAFTDDFLRLQSLERKYGRLPVSKPGEAPRVAWRSLMEYRSMVGENVRAAKYHRVVQILNRLNQIHLSVVPPEVMETLEIYKRNVDPFRNVAKRTTLDRSGRALAAGRRKSSTAQAWVVEGTGEVLVNGKTLAESFSRIHDRESAIWALKATDRIDKYNVWARVSGGGSTGQAEALTLAVAKALLVHEPALKPALRRAGCVTRDPRRVERKKPGHVKARKMPAWVKR